MSKVGDEKFGRGGGKQPREKAQRFNDVKFVQYELDKAQQAECKAWSVTEADVFAAMEALISDGYKFTIKFDDWSDSFAAFLAAPADPAERNSGSILTGRGSSAWKSVKQVLYKHHIALQGDWSAYLERGNRSPLDD